MSFLYILQFGILGMIIYNQNIMYENADLIIGTNQLTFNNNKKKHKNLLKVCSMLLTPLAHPFRPPPPHRSRSTRNRGTCCHLIPSPNRNPPSPRITHPLHVAHSRTRSPTEHRENSTQHTTPPTSKPFQKVRVQGQSKTKNIRHKKKSVEGGKQTKTKKHVVKYPKNPRTHTTTSKHSHNTHTLSLSLTHTHTHTHNYTHTQSHTHTHNRKHFQPSPLLPRCLFHVNCIITTTNICYYDYDYY